MLVVVVEHTKNILVIYFFSDENTDCDCNCTCDDDDYQFDDDKVVVDAGMFCRVDFAAFFLLFDVVIASSKNNRISMRAGRWDE